jgi:hypothetical protein
MIERVENNTSQTVCRACGRQIQISVVPFLGEMSPAVRIVRTNGRVEKMFFCSTDCSDDSLVKKSAKKTIFSKDENANRSQILI